MARWSTSARAWLRVWVADCCWPSRASTPARTGRASPGGGQPGAARPRCGVGGRGAADRQRVPGEGLDAEQVTVGQGPARFARLDAVVVAGADDQVAGAGPGAVGDGHRGSILDDAKGDKVIADAAVQFPAQ